MHFQKVKVFVLKNYAKMSCMKDQLEKSSKKEKH